jgi:hypothetical protein
VTDPFAAVRTQDGDSGAASVEDGMIDSTGSVRDEVATKTVDFRKGAERRAAPMARQPAYPFSGSIKVKTRDFR